MHAIVSVGLLRLKEDVIIERLCAIVESPYESVEMKDQAARALMRIQPDQEWHERLDRLIGSAATGDVARWLSLAMGSAE
jgi:hypothetical protein